LHNLDATAKATFAATGTYYHIW